MPKWTYKITVANRLERDLELISSSIPWGQELTFPDLIEAGKIVSYEVHSSAGTMTGIEFYATLQDKIPQETDAHYGMVEIKVDMPYWNTKNTTSCTGTGVLEVSNFSAAPDGVHDFSTTVSISKKQL